MVRVQLATFGTKQGIEGTLAVKSRGRRPEKRDAHRTRRMQRQIVRRYVSHWGRIAIR